jgi:hypothetical protein
VSATTSSGSAVTAENLASTASATCRVSEERGSERTPVSSKRAPAKGTASTTSPAPTTTTTGTARRWITRERRAKAPCAADGADGPMRWPNRASSAGSRVRAAAMQAITTAMPATASRRMPATSNTSRPVSATATVQAENTTVRPAVATVRRTAAGTSSPAPRSSRNRLSISRP